MTEIRKASDRVFIEVQDSIAIIREGIDSLLSRMEKEMATRTVTDCDKCLKKAVDTKKVFIKLDSRWNGVETEDIGIEPDMCFECTSNLVSLMLKKIGPHGWTPRMVVDQFFGETKVLDDFQRNHRQEKEGSRKISASQWTTT